MSINLLFKYSHAPGCPILIVGTHIDQVSKYELPITSLKSRFPSIAGFHFVSCIDGTNIRELAKEIINIALAEKYMGEKIPECWLQLEEKLNELKANTSLIDYKEIETLATKYGIFDKSELNQTIQFLHDLGSLLYFNNEFLKNKIIINPQYIVDMMACLVSVNQNYIENGKLYHQNISNIWKEYDITLHSWIMKLTERFDLTFNVNESDMHLVPCLLPDEPTEAINWPLVNTDANNSGNNNATCLTKEIIIYYNFDYLPAGLFNRLQVRLFQISDNKNIWKNGSLLKKNNHLTLLHRQRDANRIEIKVQGVHPENILFFIHEVLELLINESFNGVRYDFLFPCPDCIDINAIDIEKSMFSGSLVRRAFEMKAAFLQCRQHFHAVSLIDLNARFPPDSAASFDLQLRYSIRDLKHFKKCFNSDIAIIYSIKDTLEVNDDSKIIQPRRIKADLESNGYTCWFSETLNTLSFDTLVLALRSTNLILFCLSDNFSNDENCVKIFSYVKNILKKPYQLVTLGDGNQWQKGQIGAMIAQEVFIKINTIERYKTRLPELLEQLKKRINDKDRLRKQKNQSQCFISYCHSNSHDAVNKGAQIKSDFSLGKYDPRSIKSYLESKGYSTWLDIDQVGAGGKATLFEDIVEGIRNAKAIIACISNEYSQSESCMKEFRFSINLKKPIIMCVFGSHKANATWRNNELGIMSCLNTREINFQLENPDAYSEIVDELKKYNIEPESKKQNSEIDDDNDELALNEQKEIAYTELIELAQRKFLRQIIGFVDPSSKPFPRLFVIDIENVDLDKDEADKQTTISSSAKIKRNTLIRTRSVDERGPKYCLKALCEHENGWVSIYKVII